MVVTRNYIFGKRRNKMAVKKTEEHIREKAILIAKNISYKKTAQEDAIGIQKMKLGFFESSDKKDIRKYFLEFMTAKGPISYLVKSNIYHTINIDSLGFLESYKNQYVGFDFIKLATPDDVKLLGW